MCQGFSHFTGFLHHFVLAKLAISSIRVKTYLNMKVELDWGFSTIYIKLWAEIILEQIKTHSKIVWMKNAF